MERTQKMERDKNMHHMSSSRLNVYDERVCEYGCFAVCRTHDYYGILGTWKGKMNTTKLPALKFTLLNLILDVSDMPQTAVG